MVEPSATPPVDDFYLRLLTRGRARPVFFEDPGGGVAHILQTITDQVLEYVRAAPGWSEQDPTAALLESDRVAVRTIPPVAVQALTVWHADRHVIAVNSGLALYLYRLARAFAVHALVRGPNDPPVPPEEQAIGRIATLLDWMASPVAAPLVPDWPIGPREQRIAENYTTAAERFVVSHEIGHILFRHLIVDSSAVDADRATPEELERRPTEQEIQADVAGAFLTVESMMHGGIAPQAGVAGMQFFLQALELAENVGLVLHDETHPPPGERLDLCYAALRERYGTDAAALQPWADETRTLLDRLGSAALRERDQRCISAESRMTEIFRSSPWSRDHRDVELLDEVLDLMNTTPSIVVPALADNLLDADAYVRVMSARDYEENDAWRRHQLALFFTRHATFQVRQILGVTPIP